MIRLTQAPRSDFEQLALAAQNGAPGFRDARYPLGAEPGGGRVFFRTQPDGSLQVEVDARAWLGGTADPRVRRLFATGVERFASVDDLFEFCQGPLAAAFSEPTPRSRSSTHSAPSFVVDPAGLAQVLGRRVHGQDPALQTISAAVAAHLAKAEPRRPGAALLLGPTGVGKTSAIESLPAALDELGYPSALRFHRVDCAELSEWHRVSQLLGSPPGYVGYQDETEFIKALAEPTMLLLDEIEKAHPVFFTTILGLLDAGRVTSGAGRTVDARKSFVFMTSNLGHDLEQELDEATLHDRSALRNKCRDLLRNEGVPPEVVGRIGTFALFRELDDDTLAEIAADAVRRVGSEYGFAVEEVDRIVALTVLDIAGTSGTGVRGLEHAATDLVAHALARAAHAGVSGAIDVYAGPPIEIVRSGERSSTS